MTVAAAADAEPFFLGPLDEVGETEDGGGHEGPLGGVLHRFAPVLEGFAFVNLGWVSWK